MPPIPWKIEGIVLMSGALPNQYSILHDAIQSWAGKARDDCALTSALKALLDSQYFHVGFGGGGLIQCSMQFEIEQDSKHLIFDSDLRGLKINGVEYISGKDGILIYDKTREVRADNVELQMSTNTSTLIPALRVLDIPYNPYFDERPVVDSQNNITFYWKPSKLAAFYNRFSTDELGYEDREPVIRQAVDFLISTSDSLLLQEEFLARMLEPCKLLGFYQGFPIFDSSVGFAKLLSRLGIHIGSEEIMVSTPLDQYEPDVYELAELLSRETGLDYSKKKNRVLFTKTPELLRLLGVNE